MEQYINIFFSDMSKKKIYIQVIHVHARAHAYYTTFIILIIIRIQLWGRWPSCILQGPYSTQIRQS